MYIYTMCASGAQPEVECRTVLCALCALCALCSLVPCAPYAPCPVYAVRPVRSVHPVRSVRPVRSVLDVFVVHVGNFEPPGPLSKPDFRYHG